MGDRLTTDLPLAALRAGGAVPSMGKKGDYFGNAVVASFFSTLKRELLLGTCFTRARRGVGKSLSIWRCSITGSVIIRR